MTRQAKRDSVFQLMIVVGGYPAADAVLPRVTRKPLDEIASFH